MIPLTNMNEEELKRAAHVMRENMIREVLDQEALPPDEFRGLRHLSMARIYDLKENDDEEPYSVFAIKFPGS